MNNYALIIESPIDNFSLEKIHSDWVHLFRERYGLIDFGTYENFCDLVDDVLAISPFFSPFRLCV